MNPIQGINPTAATPPPLTLDGGKAVDGPSFKDFMLEALDHVNSMQHDADQAVQELATGGDVNPAEVLTAVQKADMTFRLMLQVRNKLVQAYQEVREIRI
jgi:flagellar hook-basal body complex protein FliE